MGVTTQGKVAGSLAGVVAAFGAAVLAFTGCQSSDQDAPTPSRVSSTAARANPPVVAGASTPAPSSTSGVSGSAPRPVTSSADNQSAANDSATASAASSTSLNSAQRAQLQQTQAASVARQFVQAYARPTNAAAYAAWWQTAAPFITEDQQQQLHVDPLSLPYTTVTGTVKFVGTAPGSADLVVDVPTDHNTWRVRLRAHDSSFLVDGLQERTPAVKSAEQKKADAKKAQDKKAQDKKNADAKKSAAKKKSK